MRHQISNRPPAISPFNRLGVIRRRGHAACDLETAAFRNRLSLVNAIAQFRCAAYGDKSSRTRPFVSIANRAVTDAPTSSTQENTAKTYWMPKPAITEPTTIGPAYEPRRSQASPRHCPLGPVFGLVGAGSTLSPNGWGRHLETRQPIGAPYPPPIYPESPFPACTEMVPERC